MPFRFVSLFFLLLFLYFGIFEAKLSLIKGLYKRDAVSLKITQESFTCRDGSFTLPIFYLNDDYCDCPDGSDEPGTSACSNGIFYCNNRGFVGKYIFSSQVGDSICDCCDGSDEERKVSCPNTCAEQALLQRKSVNDEIQRHKEGSQIRKEYISQAIQKVEADQLRRSELERQVEALKLEQKLQAEKETKAKEEESEARERIATERESHFSEYNESSTSVDLESSESSVFNSESTGKKVNDIEKSIEDSSEESESFPTSSEQEQTQQDNYEEEDFYNEDEEELKSFVEATKRESNLLKEIERNLHSAERDLADLTMIISTKFGEDNAFYPLYGQCLTTETVEYTYELCPFDKVTQIAKRGGSSTSLGKWDAKKQTDQWNKEFRFQRYTDGARCWGGPDRSTLVEILCDKENHIADAQEPSKCEYSLKMYTPAACSEVHAVAMEMNMMASHEE